MERTFVIVKPCSLQRGIAGEIITRFERKGLKIVALKMYRFTKEVAAGRDCGMSIAGYNDIKEGDIIEAFTIVEIKRSL